MSTPETTCRCLVFGCSGAIGSSVCRILAREGAQLALTYNTGEAAATSLSGELGACLVQQCDLANMDDIR
ncbi:MAG: NmrA family NAD(P)-binding protein, partial [Planctomycetota bacterium]|nr:NmrA family NAD(P)-binding protein [Planctomycetota bacterium]